MIHFSTELIRDQIACDTKYELIHDMVNWLSIEGYNEEKLQKIKNAVIEREMIMSTSLGFGIALPHAKTTEVQKTHILVARLTKAIDFEALDGVGVDLVFLVISPIEDHKNHIQTISTISRFLNTEGKIDQLKHLNPFNSLAELWEEN